jgi:TetR/AcrR family transcriptional repressor of bet genes
MGGLLHVLGERGFEGASVGRIAKAAGLSPGLVHYHFDSKVEVLLALIEALAARLRERAAARVAVAANARERLFALIDAQVARGDDEDTDAVRAWVIIGAEALKQPEVREAYQRAVTEATAGLEGALIEALEEAGRDTSPARAGAAALWCAMEGAFGVSQAAPHLIPDGSFADQLRHMADGLIAAAPPASSTVPS